MLVLFETPAGFALFKVLDEGKLKQPDDLYKEFESVKSAQKIVHLEKFHKFESTTDALSAATALNDSKVSKSLKSFLQKSIVKPELKDKLAVIDSKLGSNIKDKLGINCISGGAVNELIRGIRQQITNLLTGLNESDFNAMTLGLSHSLSRYKIRFSPDKVDTMIVQAIGLLDDLDKDLNTYAMRVKEWYGWHFPELVKILPDNLLYAKTVKTLRIRSSKNADLSNVLPEELEKEVKDASQISMGTEISEEDMANISELCDQVIEMTEYREELFDYLKNRMQAIAPNLTILVGELVGARLIAHAGSLINLAKHPASTVQILGAEKALFRALKTKHATPKYGLIYHASIIGQTSAKNKGKMSRVVANKAALSIRVDALGDKDTAMIGEENLEKCEKRLRQIEGWDSSRQITRKTPKKLEKYDQTTRESTTYNTGSDTTITEPSNGKKDKKRKREEVEEDSSSEEEEAPKKKKQKKSEDDDGEKKKKNKKKEKDSEEKSKKKDKKEKKDKDGKKKKDKKKNKD